MNQNILGHNLLMTGRKLLRCEGSELGSNYSLLNVCWSQKTFSSPGLGRFQVEMAAAVEILCHASCCVVESTIFVLL